MISFCKMEEWYHSVKSLTPGVIQHASSQNTRTVLHSITRTVLHSITIKQWRAIISKINNTETSSVYYDICHVRKEKQK